MKQLLGLLALSAALCIAAPAKADRIDNMEEEGIQSYCANEKELVFDGARARSLDVKPAIKPVTEQMRLDYFKSLESNQEYSFPKDAVYYDSSELNVRELAFFSEWVLKGWYLADELVKDFKEHNPDATGVFLTPGAIDTIARNHEKECLHRRAGKSVSNDYFLNVASSERIIERHDANSPQQAYCTEVAVKMYNSCMTGKEHK
jgi:hypothetical protein